MEPKDIVAALNTATDQVKASAERTKQDVGEIRIRMQEVEQAVAIQGNRSTGVVGTQHNDALASFMNSTQLASLREGANSTGRVALDMSIKAALTNDGAGDSNSTGYSGQPNRWTGMGENPQRPLSILSVLPVIKVTAGTFEYMQLDGYSNAAAVQVQEGDEKAEATMPTQLVTANISTIAHFIRASQQVLDDAPQLQQILDNLLRYGVMAKLESEIINGAGGTGKIKGLVSSATTFVPTGSPMPAEVIGQAITNLQSKGWVPNVVVLNPNDWFSIQSARGTSNDGYLLGSPRDPAPPSLWNVPVAIAPSLAAGTGIVMDSAQTALLDRMQAVVVASRDDANNFTSNLVTILAELRAGLAVFSPGAVSHFDLAIS